MRIPMIVTLSMVTLLALPTSASSTESFSRPFTIAASAPAKDPGDVEKKPELSPEEKMSARYPQAVKVGDLIGLPVLDWSDQTIGFVSTVVRTREGRIQLIVPYRKQFSWVPQGGIFDWGHRPVAVPIEVVAILGRQLAALDMERPAFDAAPTWSPSESQPIPPGEVIRIAINNR